MGHLKEPEELEFHKGLNTKMHGVTHWVRGVVCCVWGGGEGGVVCLVTQYNICMYVLVV